MSQTPITALVLADYGLAADTPIRRFGNGHINYTYMLDATPPVIVQRINTHVFPDAAGMVNNALVIEHHLKAKKAQGLYSLEILEQQPSIDHRYLTGADKDLRALKFIPGGRSIEVVETSEQAYAAAFTFGQFAAALADFDAKQLVTVIPDFHNLRMRYGQLTDAIALNKAGRLQQVLPLVDWVLTEQHLVDELEACCASLPIRVCHNDTKINNMLYSDALQRGIAAIDLDTCMAGYWLFDFGDMVRTCCSPEAEDTLEHDKVKVRPDVFAALARGYLDGLDRQITAAERQSLWIGAKAMCLMIGIRFLTDHLNGDVYFHVHRTDHNLQRATNQFRLYQDLLAQESTLLAFLAS